MKINDWELAEYVCGPVDGPRLRAAAERLRERGRRRGRDHARRASRRLAVDGERAWDARPAAASSAASREGCGDSMMGALAAALADGHGLRARRSRSAPAAGAANFLRHGLGTRPRHGRSRS